MLIDALLTLKREYGELTTKTPGLVAKTTDNQYVMTLVE